MKTIFLALSALITVVSIVPYLRDILRGTTKPNLVSWITWTLLTGVATAAEVSAHEYVAAAFTGATMIQTLSVVVVGLRHGYVKYTQFDVMCQVAAVIGIIVWQLLNSPAIGVVAAVVIDLVGVLPTFRHAWLAPGEETWQTFAISALGGALALAALTTYNWISLPYAVYIVLADTILAAVIFTREKTKTVAVS